VSHNSFKLINNRIWAMLATPNKSPEIKKKILFTFFYSLHFIFGSSRIAYESETMKQCFVFSFYLQSKLILEFQSWWFHVGFSLFIFSSSTWELFLVFSLSLSFTLSLTYFIFFRFEVFFSRLMKNGFNLMRLHYVWVFSTYSEAHKPFFGFSSCLYPRFFT
jgi:hypothetical protein